MATASTGIVNSVLNHDTAATPNTGALRDAAGNLTGAQLIGTSIANSGGMSGGVTVLTVNTSIATPSKRFYEVNAAGATTQTITALASAFTGQEFWITNIGAGTVTLAGVTGTTSLATNAKALVYSDGTTWYAL